MAALVCCSAALDAETEDRSGPVVTGIWDHTSTSGRAVGRSRLSLSLSKVSSQRRIPWPRRSRAQLLRLTPRWAPRFRRQAMQLRERCTAGLHTTVEVQGESGLNLCADLAQLPQ